MSEPKGIEDVQKAAILLMSLDKEQASKVMKYLSPKEVQNLGMTMSTLTDVNKSLQDSVFSDFVNQSKNKTEFGLNNQEHIKELMVTALGEDKATGIMNRILMDAEPKGLETLKWMEPDVVADIIINEHPQIQSIVLSYLDPEVAGEVLMYFDPKLRLDLIMRISNQEELPPEAIEELNEILETQINPRKMQKNNIGGTKVVASILNNVDKTTEQDLLDALKKTDENLCEEIEELMFIFDNLRKLDDKGFQSLLREISTESLVLAIKACEEDLKDMFLNNMSKRARTLLLDDLEMLGPVKMSDVEQAQKEILMAAKKLADDGTINLGNKGEEMV